ncbi:ABC transporter ATP-binding protein [Aquipseudomonas alcaligenes]|uniref:Lipopolysaccharide transport system ATP-binding protein n=1 Tax=Aquipseudomonas alcaligenes TaxID=43263 RepID=A0A1N6RTB9_AQUAC|nr:ABC transporter ATP-binding protein [Pseudomonas alcaligenes]SIQ31972.1 lipopolysaccharide transport system ATP-binding protein [Pseudomonas alcaligenes]
MSSNTAIRITGLSKCYQVYSQPRDRLKQFLLPSLQSLAKRPIKQYFQEFWALKDVSFEIHRGETVGILGRNGSGKSTLLQLICGTLNPSAGSIDVNGRIAALLELGSGFNPEFTGRENVYLSGTLLGMSLDEINERFDSIAAFADIGDFLDRAVKTYSSGMFVRLAFAVNIMSQPEIMIVDEALAVGDMSFQAKCMTALRRIQDNGSTVLFVSHDIGSVKSLCSRAIYLDRGRLIMTGKASVVAEDYVKIMREEMNSQHKEATQPSAKEEASSPSLLGTDASYPQQRRRESLCDAFARRVAQFRYGSGKAKVDYAELLDMNDQPLLSADFDQQVKIRFQFHVLESLNVAPSYYILDDKKNLILGAGPRQLNRDIPQCIPGKKYVVTYATTLPLHEGNYSIQLQLNCPIIPDETAEFLDVIDDAILFNVQRRQNGRIWAKILLPNQLEIVAQ